MATGALFYDREEGGRALAPQIAELPLYQPIVLGIPRGGVVTAAALAREIHADLDVVIARKIPAPGQSELALAALSEGGYFQVDERVARLVMVPNGYLAEQTIKQSHEIIRRQKLFRGLADMPDIEGRTVIVVDDGAATGSTLVVALEAVRARKPRHLYAAVPVVAPDSINRIRECCDSFVFVAAPEDFQAVGQFYTSFRQVEDQEAANILHTWVAEQSPANF